MAMSGKPTAVLAMPVGTFAKMFHANDLRRPSDQVDIIGPVDAKDPDALRSAISRADYLLTGWGSPMLTPALLDGADHLKLVAHTAGSIKPIATDAVYDRGISITTAAGANAVPVAQYTVAMMVSLLKQIPWLTQAYMRGDEAEVRRRKSLARELEDMSIAIIGASRVGREVIRLLKPYPALSIYCYDPYLSQQQADELGVKRAGLEECCRCELVSIHAPNIPETFHMFNARTLGLLPDHAVLINTARGALLDEAALLRELRRRPLYVMLDVTDPEPLPVDSPLRREPDVLITPHIAGAMNQSCKTMGRMAIEEILRHLSGNALRDEVTREMLATQA